MLSWLSMLRMACSHPLLVTGGRTATAALCGRKGPSESQQCVQCRQTSDDVQGRWRTCSHRVCDACVAPQCPMCRLVADFRAAPSSSKLDRLGAIMDKRPKGSKTLVFSQWVTQLDLAEFMMRRLLPKVALFRIDGSVQDRAAVLRQTEACADTAILFCSLRTCAHGINMQWADCVVFLDQDYNPQMERQALKRVHRLGQTKPVHVYRLITSTRVDAAVAAMQTKKLREAEEFVEGEAPNVHSKRADMSDVVSIFMALRRGRVLSSNIR